MKNSPKQKILIVEDDQYTTYLLTEFIKDHLNVSSVESLGTAIKYLIDERFDAIILDLNLPDSRGLDTLKTVSVKFPELPIIIFTGIDDSHIINQAIQEGAQDYLVKTHVDEDNLLRSIRYAIERKKTETILKEKEERYKSLFEGSRDAIFIADIETGIIIDVNMQAERLLKKSKDEIIGNHFTTLHPPENHDHASYVFEKYKLSERSKHGHKKNMTYIDILTSENEKIPVEINASIITLPDGRQIIQGIFRDITERIKYEKELKDTEYKWRSFTENSAEYIVQTNLEGEIQFANRDGIFIKDKAIGASIYEHLSDNFKQDVRNCLERVRNTKKPDVCYAEYLTENENKNPKVFEQHITPLIRSEDVVGFIINSLDVTNRKRIEDALKESEEKYRSIVENSNDMIWLIDSDYKYIFFNKRAENLSGYELDELKNRQFVSLVLEEDQRKVADVLRNVLQEGKPQHYDFSFYDKQGNKITVSANSVPIYSDGKIVGISSFGRDITEQKRAEEEIKSMQEQLTKSNREIEQFAYIASHDLQEPLRSVSSFTELFATRYKGRLDSEADEFIDFILSGTNRMKEMINDLLTLSRVKTREKPFNETNISTVLEQVLLNLHNLIITNRARITIGDMPTIFGDQSQLIQLFQNLIDNAIKFRKKDIFIQPQIDISVRKEKDEWIFSIKDNGIGIDPKNFNKLFLMFTRLHNRDEYPGTGIGLAICKKIVERHNGKIWVESKLGEGSTFYFSIPEARPRRRPTNISLFANVH